VTVHTADLYKNRQTIQITGEKYIGHKKYKATVKTVEEN
jgi:hypothetical protein